jgi:hypothetical protein
LTKSAYSKKRLNNGGFMSHKETEDFEKSFDEAAQNGEGQKKAEASDSAATEEEGKADAEPISTEEKKDNEEILKKDGEGSEQSEEEKTKLEAEKAGEGSAEALSYEKLLQQKKSLEGMFNPLKSKLDKTEGEKTRLAEENAALEAEKARLEGELEKLRAGNNKTEDKSGSGDKEIDGSSEGGSDNSSEGVAKKKLKELIDDYPEVNELMELQISPLLKQIEDLKKAVAPISESISAGEEQRRKTALEKHVSEIRTAHADYDQIIASEDIQNWILEQPEIIRDAYVKTWDKGTSKDMIRLVADYKQAKGLSVAHKSDAEIKLANGETVQTKRTTVSGGNQAGKDDFEGAFEEAARSG